MAEAAGLGFDLTTEQSGGDMGKILGRIAIQDWAMNPDFMLNSGNSQAANTRTTKPPCLDSGAASS